MAGDWIKMRHDLPEDPAVIAIAVATGLGEDAVVGKLHRFWSWADRQTVNGNAVGVTQTWLDRFVSCDGFASAMVAAGWLEVTDAGLAVPGFDVHISESAKTRALAARRAAKHRNANRNGGSVTKSAPREEKRREDIDSPNGESCSEPPVREPARSGYYFPMLDGKLWTLPQRKLDEYQATYGDRLDLDAIFRLARQWLTDNKSRRPRSASGMPAFLTRWLNRDYEKAVKTIPGSRAAAIPNGKVVFNAETGEFVTPLE